MFRGQAIRRKWDTITVLNRWHSTANKGPAWETTKRKKNCLKGKGLRLNAERSRILIFKKERGQTTRGKWKWERWSDRRRYVLKKKKKRKEMAIDTRIKTRPLQFSHSIYHIYRNSCNLLSTFCTRNIQNFLLYFHSIYRISSSSFHVKNVLRYLCPMIFRTTRINYRKTIKPKETKSKRAKERQNIFFQK